MKITKSQLKQIIKEELQHVLSEVDPFGMPADPAAGATSAMDCEDVAKLVYSSAYKSYYPPADKEAEAKYKQLIAQASHCDKDELVAQVKKGIGHAAYQIEQDRAWE